MTNKTKLCQDQLNILVEKKWKETSKLTMDSDKESKLWFLILTADRKCIIIASSKDHMVSEIPNCKNIVSLL